MFKKTLAILSLLLVAFATPLTQDTIFNATASAITMGIYDEVRTYDHYMGENIWVQTDKETQLSSGYLYYSHKTWDWQTGSFTYTYYGTLTPNGYASNLTEQ